MHQYYAEMMAGCESENNRATNYDRQIWIVGTRDWCLEVTTMSFLFIENSKMASSISQLTNNRHRQGITSQQMGMFCAALWSVPKNKKTVLTSVNQ